MGKWNHCGNWRAIKNTKENSTKKAKHIRYRIHSTIQRNFFFANYLHWNWKWSNHWNTLLPDFLLHRLNGVYVFYSILLRLLLPFVGRWICYVFVLLLISSSISKMYHVLTQSQKFYEILKLANMVSGLDCVWSHRNKSAKPSISACTMPVMSRLLSIFIQSVQLFGVRNDNVFRFRRFFFLRSIVMFWSIRLNMSQWLVYFARKI